MFFAAVRLTRLRRVCPVGQPPPVPSTVCETSNQPCKKGCDGKFPLERSTAPQISDIFHELGVVGGEEGSGNCRSKWTNDCVLSKSNGRTDGNLYADNVCKYNNAIFCLWVMPTTNNYSHQQKNCRRDVFLRGIFVSPDISIIARQFIVLPHMAVKTTANPRDPTCRPAQRFDTRNRQQQQRRQQHPKPLAYLARTIMQILNSKSLFVW